MFYTKPKVRHLQDFQHDYATYKEAMFRILEHAEANILSKKADKNKKFREDWDSLSAEDKAKTADYIKQLHDNKNKYH